MGWTRAQSSERGYRFGKGEQLKYVSQRLLNPVQRMLEFKPQARISAVDSLSHPFVRPFRAKCYQMFNISESSSLMAPFLTPPPAIQHFSSYASSDPVAQIVPRRTSIVQEYESSEASLGGLPSETLIGSKNVVPDSDRTTVSALAASDTSLSAPSSRRKRKFSTSSSSLLSAAVAVVTEDADKLLSNVKVSCPSGCEKKDGGDDVVGESNSKVDHDSALIDNSITSRTRSKRALNCV